MQGVSIHREWVDWHESFSNRLDVGRVRRDHALRDCAYLDGHILCSVLEGPDYHAPPDSLGSDLWRCSLFDHELCRAATLCRPAHAERDHTRVTDQRSARHFVVHWTTHLASYPQNTVSNAHLTFRGRERHQQQNETARRVCAECKEKRLELFKEERDQRVYQGACHYRTRSHGESPAQCLAAAQR